LPPERSATMVSRRRILSRSRDDLNLPEAPIEEEDVWFAKDKLLKVRTKIICYATLSIMHDFSIGKSLDQYNDHLKNGFAHFAYLNTR